MLSRQVAGAPGAYEWQRLWLGEVLLLRHQLRRLPARASGTPAPWPRLAAFGADLAPEKPFDDGDGLGTLVDQAAPVQVAGHNAHQGVTDFLLVHHDALVVPQPRPQLLVEFRQD